MENPITSRISHREMLPLKVPRYAFETVEGYQRILHSLGLAETAVGHVYYVYYTESIESSGIPNCQIYWDTQLPYQYLL